MYVNEYFAGKKDNFQRGTTAWKCSRETSAQDELTGAGRENSEPELWTRELEAYSAGATERATEVLGRKRV